MDPALAEEWAKHPMPESSAPPLRGFDPLMSKLTDIVDQLIALRGAFAGEDAPPPKFSERPQPAVNVVRERIRRTESTKRRVAALSRLLPGQEV